MPVKTAEEVAAERLAEEQRKAAVRAQLTAEAAFVMENSRPTPSQSDVDKVRLGLIDHDEKEEVSNPEMPPVHVQRQDIAGADERAAYRTRQMAAARPVRREAAPAPSDEAPAVASSASGPQAARR